jgi:hypothetical protein
MQSGVVAAEEGEMIASVRNLDSKKIKARCGSLQIEPATTLPPLPPYQCPANGLPGDHDAIGGHDLYRISGAHCEASSSHQGDSVPRIRWDPVGSGVHSTCCDWFLARRLLLVGYKLPPQCRGEFGVSQPSVLKRFDLVTCRYL